MAEHEEEGRAAQQWLDVCFRNHNRPVLPTTKFAFPIIYHDGVSLCNGVVGMLC